MFSVFVPPVRRAVNTSLSGAGSFLRGSVSTSVALPAFLLSESYFSTRPLPPAAGSTLPPSAERTEITGRIDFPRNSRIAANGRIKFSPDAYLSRHVRAKTDSRPINSSVETGRVLAVTLPGLSIISLRGGASRGDRYALAVELTRRTDAGEAPSPGLASPRFVSSRLVSLRRVE